MKIPVHTFTLLDKRRDYSPKLLQCCVKLYGQNFVEIYNVMRVFYMVIGFSLNQSSLNSLKYIIFNELNELNKVLYFIK